MNSINHPKIVDRSFLVLYELNKEIKKTLNSDIIFHKKGNIILDIGCGTKPYLYLFSEIKKEYIGIDLNNQYNPDIVCNADKLPFKNETFDIVFSSQVLEHVEKPEQVINEIYRTLKYQGIVLLSTHGVWNKHANNDFWRWTDVGLKYMFSSFIDVEIKCNGGTILCFFQILNLYIGLLPLGKRMFWLLFNILGKMLDNIFHYEDFLIINYLVIGKKGDITQKMVIEKN